MYNKIYILTIQHYDCFTGNDYKEIVANSLKEVAAIKKSATWFIDS